MGLPLKVSGMVFSGGLGGIAHKAHACPLLMLRPGRAHPAAGELGTCGLLGLADTRLQIHRIRGCTPAAGLSANAGSTPQASADTMGAFLVCSRWVLGCFAGTSKKQPQDPTRTSAHVLCIGR